MNNPDNTTDEFINAFETHCQCVYYTRHIPVLFSRTSQESSHTSTLLLCLLHDQVWDLPTYSIIKQVLETSLTGKDRMEEVILNTHLILYIAKVVKSVELIGRWVEGNQS